LDTTHFLTRGSTTVVRLDAAGVERWRTTIPEHRIQRLDVDGDEVVLCLGQQNGILDQYPLRVTRLDADGATLWSELLASGAIQASFTVSEVLFEPTSGDVLVQWAVESGGFSASSVGITSIDASGDVAWTWSPSGLSGLEQTAGGMVFGASGGLLVGAVGRVSFDDRTRIYDLDPLTGAERHSIEFLERSIGAEKGLQPLPGGGAMVVLYDWPAGPFLVTLDADLDVTSTLALQPPPVSAIDPRTRLQTATPDGRGGLVLTGYDSYSGAPQPGVYLFRMKVAAGVDLGAAYCAQTSPNSTGATTALEAFGSAAAADDDVTLIGSALPPFAASLFLVADQAGFAPNAGGSQGTLCLGGAIGRYNRPGEVQFASAEGGVTLRLDLANTPGPSAVFAVLPGTTWRFQLWHRDMNPGQTSNLSNALEVTFL
ncbi:MAG: PQQ-binding-like beta-propeller repeat protein, partial [Planctomycetota bacterium]